MNNEMLNLACSLQHGLKQQRETFELRRTKMSQKVCEVVQMSLRFTNTSQSKDVDWQHPKLTRSSY